MYLSHLVNEKGGSSDHRIQTHKEITLWCFDESEFPICTSRMHSHLESCQSCAVLLFLSESLSFLLAY